MDGSQTWGVGRKKYEGERNARAEKVIFAQHLRRAEEIQWFEAKGEEDASD